MQLIAAESRTKSRRVACATVSKDDKWINSDWEIRNSQLPRSSLTEYFSMAGHFERNATTKLHIQFLAISATQCVSERRNIFIRNIGTELELVCWYCTRSYADTGLCVGLLATTDDNWR